MIEGNEPVPEPIGGVDRAALRVLYQSCNYLPLWLDVSGRPHADARVAMALLGAAVDEGLSATDYYQTTLTGLLPLQSASLSPRLRARFDVALSAGMLRYLHDVHRGRVDPRSVGFRLSIPADRHDYAALLRAALTQHRIAATVESLRPPIGQYRALRDMLRTYRSLAEHESAPVPVGVKAVHPGETFVELKTLYRRLVSVGDIPGAVADPGNERYEGEVVEGVKRFQIRHGLEPDGVLGKETQAALRAPLSWRVRQIELALERLRWLPHLGDQRLVVLNIPMFRMWAWDSVSPDARPALAMDVIVGRALSTQTPVFVEEMREVIFRPYWNVPRSILQHEILPILRRDPDYLRRQDMEIVRARGDAATPVGVTDENLTALRNGALRLRQRPGRSNALGLIKFVFPNDLNVYMHGTPAPELFNRNRRDFSHGCVRVRDPIGLARWALRGVAEGSRERIVASIAGPQSVRVKLTHPIQVILFYTTAAVMVEDRTMRFAQDIYGHDTRLDRALRGPSSPGLIESK